MGIFLVLRDINGHTSEQEYFCGILTGWFLAAGYKAKVSRPPLENNNNLDECKLFKPCGLGKSSIKVDKNLNWVIISLRHCFKSCKVFSKRLL